MYEQVADTERSVICERHGHFTAAFSLECGMEDGREISRRLFRLTLLNNPLKSFLWDRTNTVQCKPAVECSLSDYSSVPPQPVSALF